MFTNPSLKTAEPTLHEFSLIDLCIVIGGQRCDLWRWPFDRIVVDFQDAQAGHLGEIGWEAFDLILRYRKDLLQMMINERGHERKK
jgi:hypothetical protein